MSFQSPTRSDPAPAPPALRHAILVLTLLSLCSFVNTVRQNRFVWDDRGFLEGDWLEAHRRDPLSAFTRGSMEGSARWGNPGYYRPLVTLLMVVDFAFYGRDPAGYHLTNVFLHVACTLLVFVCLRRILGPGWVPFLAGAIFAVHPVHAESVAFVSGRTDLLYTLFLLISALLFLDARAGILPAFAWSGSLVAFAAALLSKETAACLPLLLLLIVATDGPGGRRKWFSLLPHGALLGAFLVLRMGILPGAGSVTRYPYPGGGLGPTLVTMPGVLLGYLKTSFLPVPLAVYRDVPILQSLLTPWAMASLVAALIILHAGLWARRHRTLLFAWAWFLFPLLPVSNLIPTGTMQADRYLYLPVLGAAIVIARALEHLILRRRRSGVTLLAALVVLFFALTQERNREWRTDVSLWRANVADFPESVDGRMNLGAALGEAGHLLEAVRVLREVEEVAPGHPLISFNLGVALEELARGHLPGPSPSEYHRQAMEAYRRSIALSGHWQAYERLGLLLIFTGDQKEEGKALLRKALPSSAAAFTTLADFARDTGETEEEMKLLVGLLEHHPGHWEGALRLGELLAKAGRVDEARSLYLGILGQDGVDVGIRGLAARALQALPGP